MYQFIEQAQKNQSNPQEIFKQITSNYTPEQMQHFKQYANNFGFSDEQLKQYGINAK